MNFFVSSTKKTAMVWTEDHDVLLCREVIAAEPFEAKKGTVQRSTKWAQVASSLSEVQRPHFKVDKRSVRDRYNLLADRLRQKFKREAKASGIATEMSEAEQALEFLIEKEDAAEEHQKEDSEEKRKKAAADRVGAEEVRRKAMERLAITQKRKAEEEGAGKSRKRRSNGNDTVNFLRERNEQQMTVARSRLELQEKQIEAEGKRHDDLIKWMQQQQQMQMQNFQFIMAQHQQQQQQQQQQHAELMLKLFDKLSNK